MHVWRWCFSSENYRFWVLGRLFFECISAEPRRTKKQPERGSQIPVLPRLNSLPEYTSGTTSKHALRAYPLGSTEGSLCPGALSAEPKSAFGHKPSVFALWAHPFPALTQRFCLFSMPDFTAFRNAIFIKCLYLIIIALLGIECSQFVSRLIIHQGR